MSDWIREMAKETAEGLWPGDGATPQNTGIIMQAIKAAIAKDLEERADPLRMLEEMAEKELGVSGEEIVWAYTTHSRAGYENDVHSLEFEYRLEPDLVKSGWFDTPPEAIKAAHKELFNSKPKGDSNGRETISGNSSQVAD